MTKPQVIHIAHIETLLHFDVNHFNFIQYKGPTDLSTRLRSRVVETLREIERQKQESNATATRPSGPVDFDRDLSIRPQVEIDFAEYYERGGRYTRVVFRNHGPGVAFIRGITLTERIVSKFDQSVEGVTLHHSLPQIVLQPHQVRHTNVRSRKNADLVIALDVDVTFTVTANVYNSYGGWFEDYERTWDFAQSSVYVDKEHGDEVGDWLNADRSNYGFLL